MTERPTLKLRNATPADAGALAALIQELGYDLDSSGVTAWLQRINGSPADRIIVAERAADIVGYASVHIMPFPHENTWVARLTAMVVRSDNRREGVGAALLERAEQFARAADCARIELTARNGREQAHAFYDRHDYGPGDHAYFVKRL